ncbi:MAG: hypothetical protein KKA31_02795 [Candidatus Margulisbacteria bacterium]|nr:hypothetical protein [Candidatus Margulisiibacteriota bacterium]
MSILMVYQSLFHSRFQVFGADEDSCQTREEINFHDVSTVLDHILKSVPEGSSLAFGYTHRKVASHRSAVGIFADEIVPHLVSKGYTDLVLEIFPKGTPADIIEQEIEGFNCTGTIGAEMKRFLDVYDKSSFTFLLDKIGQLNKERRQKGQEGIKIHSGGVDYSNIHQTFLYPNFDSFPQRLNMARKEVARNTKKTIEFLAGKGRKVFSLNGCLHNDLYPHPKKALASFGKELKHSLAGRFVEIDLVIPELSARRNYYQDLALSSKCLWKGFIPDFGVNLVSELGKNSYLLFWPKLS